jgi:hypothetical protein
LALYSTIKSLGLIGAERKFAVKWMSSGRFDVFPNFWEGARQYISDTPAHAFADRQHDRII